MNDCISRQAVLDVLDMYIDNLGMIKDEVKELPSVTPTERTGHWIPVSERLPKPDVDVLVTDIHGNRFVHTLKYDSKDETFCWEDDAGFFVDFNDVIAWMPLPKPYEPQESEDKE